MTNKRITLTSGDYINLSDISNEQVFNLVKGCFVNAGFNTESEWGCAYIWRVFHAYYKDRACFAGYGHYSSTRQLSLSDVFNSVNGGWCWNDCEYIHVYADHVLYGDTKYPSNPPPLVSIKRIPEAPQAIIPPKTPQWWDYENGCAVGLPPVDTECQYSLSNGRTWFKCKVISQDKLVLDCPHIETECDNGLQIVNKNVVMFRPLDYKSPKQILLDKALDLAAQNMSFEDFIERLYEAGLLKGGE